MCLYIFHIVYFTSNIIIIIVLFIFIYFIFEQLWDLFLSHLGIRRSGYISAESYTRYQTDDKKVRWCEIRIPVILPQSQRNGRRRGVILFHWWTDLSSRSWEFWIQVTHNCNYSRQTADFLNEQSAISITNPQISTIDFLSILSALDWSWNADLGPEGNSLPWDLTC